jgi:hypothetical protein
MLLADGRVQGTVGLPGTGLSYSSTSSGSRQSRTGSWTVSDRAVHQAHRRALAEVPKPPQMRLQRVLLLVGLGIGIVGFVVPPLLLLAIPIVLVALVLMLMLKNLRRDQQWAKEYKAARVRALRDLP